MTPLLSRLLAVALLVLVLGSAWIVWLLPAWSGFVGRGAAIEELGDTIDRMNRLAARLGPLRDELAGLERRMGDQRLTLRAPSAPLAAAALQERVKRVVAIHGGVLASTQVLAPEAEGGFERIGLQVQMGVSTRALQAIVHALESAKPYLVLDDVDIRSRVQPRAARSRRRGTTAPVTDWLTVRFRVHGYRVREPGDAA